MVTASPPQVLLRLRWVIFVLLVFFSITDACVCTLSLLIHGGFAYVVSAMQIYAEVAFRAFAAYYIYTSYL